MDDLQHLLNRLPTRRFWVATVAIATVAGALIILLIVRFVPHA